MIRHFAFKALAAFGILAGAACAEPAPSQRADRTPAAEQAPRIERIVAFGDSYADNGNIFRLFGVTPPPLYPQGRFSDGTNFVDTMAELLRVPVVNFALGGAVTGPGRNNRPAGMDGQVDAFLGRGGPSVLPRTNGRLGPGDLVVISIGGNDARRFEKSFGDAPTQRRMAEALAAAPGAARGSVASATQALERLAAAGARNVLFLGGDVGRLPEVEGRPIARIGSAFSARYNEGMRAALARLSQRGIQARYVDLDALGDRIEADPAAFGLVSVGACPRACVGNRALARRYLFHVDGLHFTAAGYAIVGRFAVAQLAPQR